MAAAEILLGHSVRNLPEQKKKEKLFNQTHSVEGVTKCTGVLKCFKLTSTPSEQLCVECYRYISVQFNYKLNLKYNYEVVNIADYLV